jgi:polysaccharide pyruvyl transferase WcaK-like protein
MMLYAPRLITANRGDLASRLGLLAELQRGREVSLHVDACKDADLAGLRVERGGYGPGMNLLPCRESRRALRDADAIIWTGGLDLQDDSSLAKLGHMFAQFSLYRAAGKRIYLLMQGAGPLQTSRGRWLARRVLDSVELFIARDRDSLDLVKSLGSGARLEQGADGIFTPAGLLSDEPPQADLPPLPPGTGPVVGFNLRMWFHFANDLLPYMFARSRYRERARPRMESLIQAAARYLALLRQELDARIVLLSMYEPGVEPWEDDLPWLRALEETVGPDPAVAVLEEPLSIVPFTAFAGRLDLMVGMRLHSTLIALRQGVPAINLSYTLKGHSIFRDLGMRRWVCEVESFMRQPEALLALTRKRLAAPLETDAIREAEARNRDLLTRLIEDVGAASEAGGTDRCAASAG